LWEDFFDAALARRRAARDAGIRETPTAQDAKDRCQMNAYTVTFARSARRELELLETLAIARILPRIEALANDPRPYGCCKIKGGRNLWRIRVGDYRIGDAIEDSQRAIDVIAVRHRRDVYR